MAVGAFATAMPGARARKDSSMSAVIRMPELQGRLCRDFRVFMLWWKEKEES